MTDDELDRIEEKWRAHAERGDALMSAYGCSVELGCAGVSFLLFVGAVAVALHLLGWV